MTDPIDAEQDPVVFLISPSPILLEYVANASREQGLHLRNHESFEGFISSYDNQTPGCIVLCVQQYKSESVDFLRRIEAANKYSQVLLSVHDWEMPDIVHAIQEGFADFFDISKDSERLGIMLSNAVQRECKLREEARFQVPETVLKVLNAEEINIFRLMVQGKTTKQIGAELDLSIRTIHYRKTSIFQKLGVRDRSEAFETIRAIRRDNQSAVPPPHLLKTSSNTLPFRTSMNS